MMRKRTAYMPLPTYPVSVADESVLAAAGFAASLECALEVETFSVDIPRVSSPLAGLLIDIPGLVRTAEEKSKAECHRLQSLVQGAAGAHPDLVCTSRETVLGGMFDAAAAAARYFDAAVLPWSSDTVVAQHVAEAVVFGSGRPTFLVPPTARAGTLDHIAIAWDASRVAARALGDALPFLAEGGRLSVLTVQDEKPLGGPDLAGILATTLRKRGLNATPVAIPLGGRTIAGALQETALSVGAQVLAMGGFGHSRVRDFVLGGATKETFADLRLPVLLAH